jgi:hypothetical protein
MDDIKRLNEKIFSLVPSLDDGWWIVEPPVSRNPGSLSMDRPAGATGRRGAARPQMPNFALALSRAVRCRQRSAERFTPLLSSRLGQTIRLTLSHPHERWSARRIERFSADFSLAHVQQQCVQSIDQLAAAAASGESMNPTARRSNRRTVHALQCGPRFHQRGQQ